ncbi:hypothetical protein Tco_0093827 [Tanacetum coccineum]
MNTIGMSMKSLQVNIKFVNHLQPEWSKFVTDVKLARECSSTALDNTRFHQTSVVHHQSYQAPAIPQQSQASFPLLDSGLVVPLFLPSYDPIASLNKAMLSLAQHLLRYSQPITAKEPCPYQGIRKLSKMKCGNIQQVRGKGHVKDTCQERNFRTDTTAIFQNDDLDAFALICDEASSASAVLMAKLSAYDSDGLWVGTKS